MLEEMEHIRALLHAEDRPPQYMYIAQYMYVAQYMHIAQYMYVAQYMYIVQAGQNPTVYVYGICILAHINVHT
jgi:hypothetical protein